MNPILFICYFSHISTASQQMWLFVSDKIFCNIILDSKNDVVQLSILNPF